METFLIMLKNVFLFVLLAVPGYLLIRGKLLTSKQSGVLSTFLTYVGMPGLILSSTLKIEFTGAFTRRLLLTAAAGTVLILLTLVLSRLLTCKTRDAKRRGMMRLSMVFCNNGFVGIPLAMAVFGAGSEVMAHLTVLNIINNVLMFTFAASLASGDKKKMNLKQAFLNPVLLAFAAGIVLNLLQVVKAVPEVQTYANHFSNTVTPVAMVVVGMKLADVPMKKLFSCLPMYWVSAARLVIFPALCVGAAFALRLIPGLQISDHTIMGFFIGFAMPSAGLASVFADRYGGDTENAVIYTMGTTILSVLTIPVLYWALNLLF